ncbi:MAG: DEAD/DEAH box helicase [Candidatus Portnoybacteria bacterium]|nr:DEAD/DEAH box helicase [Candidatus Portnoybacteria bacterium]
MDITISGLGKRPFTLVRDQMIKPALLLRKLADFGYVKVQKLSKPGEFRFLGDTLDIRPFLSGKAFRIEFFGNEIEEITPLSPISSDSGLFEKRVEAKIAKTFLEKVQPGDYLVHLDHGIGRFKETRVIEGDSYFLLEYAGGDRLFVPFKARKKLIPYIGFGLPRLNHLKGAGWEHTKRRVKEQAQKLARELLFLYAKRALAKRLPYREDTLKEKELEKRSDFMLTPDQQKAIEDIKTDLVKALPMDRLICGDVGFGKTEVALHAALEVIENGRQVIFLTPTTILADQHYHYIKKRFIPFGINISLLSRMTKGHQDINADLIVGTHRIFSSLPQFNRLGLVIIDEEQRFGVRQKERFKELRSSIDILSLSATPIPRTFQLALAGLRDISNILTPLPGKEAIGTTVSPFDERLIKRAGEEELVRQGQIYYLVPRIKDIERAKALLESLFPGAKIAIAHGRLAENILLRTIHDFRDKRYDILIATTIIENGLDLESVNTLIVQDAQKLGLAQAHQIRGRVGRRSIKAEAYFLYNPRAITAEGKKRLSLLVLT